MKKDQIFEYWKGNHENGANSQGGYGIILV